MFSDTFGKKEIPHAGMIRKPMVPYNPDAYRNRLAQASVVMPYKNSSQLVIGDRSSYYSRQFVSTNSNVFQAPRVDVISNPGINAEQTKRMKGSQAR